MNNNQTPTNQTKPNSGMSDEYKALLRAAENAKKQAQILGVAYVVKGSQSLKNSEQDGI